jgi:hypothetical protein
MEQHCWTSQQWHPNEQDEVTKREIFRRGVFGEEEFAEPSSKSFYVIFASGLPPTAEAQMRKSYRVL